MVDIAALLADSPRIAVVGASTNPDKPAHGVPARLIEAGFDVVPVNPGADEIWGRPAVASLADIDGPIDIVDVFRPADEAPDVVRAAIAAGARAVWLQLGITSPEARALAEEAGLVYVEDRCIGVEVATNQITHPN